MADEVGSRAELEKQLEEWAIQHEELESAQNGSGAGNDAWADADRLAMQLLNEA